MSPELTLRPSLSDERQLQVIQFSPVSPELTLRPSLSAAQPAPHHPGGGRVAGANAPAFVERLSRAWPQSLPWGVAGANAPAFVERSRVQANRGVSPELTLWPSLSGVRSGERRYFGRVSPELTLRPSLSVQPALRQHGMGHGVSPELTLRPSLSVPDEPTANEQHEDVSPELTLRPSLSEAQGGHVTPHAGSLSSLFIPAGRLGTAPKCGGLPPFPSPPWMIPDRSSPSRVRFAASIRDLPRPTTRQPSFLSPKTPAK